MPTMNRTFHDRTDDRPAFGEMAATWGAAKRFLYREHLKGRTWKGDLAVSHYKDFGLGSKQWEHCWRQLMGEVSSLKECRKLETEQLTKRVASKARKVAEAEKRLKKAETEIEAQLGRRAKAAEALAAGRKHRGKAYDAAAHAKAVATVGKTRFALHQHKRKLASLEYDLEASKWPKTLCFGGRKLFAAQHHLAENGHADHAAWKADWTAARNAQFFVEGDAGFHSGNGFVRLHPQFDGTFDVEWRLPDSLKRHAETCEKVGVTKTIVHSLWIRGLRFKHGRSELYRALREGLPISWRFRQDGKTWVVSASVVLEYEEQKQHGGTCWSLGALGVDLNAGHVAATLVDRFGNPVQSWNIPLLCHGLSEAQREDAARKAASELVAIARRHGVPIVSEKLDFSEKRAALRDTVGPARARALSSFAYSAFDRALTSACVRGSVHLRRVEPAFTSVIGDLAYARRYGLSVHAAAACAIARRAMHLSERLPSPPLLERRRHADQVALVRPAWNGLSSPPKRSAVSAGYVWSAWRSISKERRAALAAPAGPWPPVPRPSEASKARMPERKARSG